MAQRLVAHDAAHGIRVVSTVACTLAWTLNDGLSIASLVPIVLSAAQLLGPRCISHKTWHLGSTLLTWLLRAHQLRTFTNGVDAPRPFDVLASELRQTMLLWLVAEACAALARGGAHVLLVPDRGWAATMCAVDRVGLLGVGLLTAARVALDAVSAELQTEMQRPSKQRLGPLASPLTLACAAVATAALVRRATPPRMWPASSPRQR